MGIEPQPKVLIVTGMYPSEANPFNGIAVKLQRDSLADSGITVDVVYFETHDLLSILSSARSIRKIAREGGYNIVHAHFGIKAALLAYLVPLPHVVTFHGEDIYGYPVKLGERVLYTLACNFAAFIDRHFSLLLDAVIVMSPHMKGLLPRRAAEKTSVIAMGVDIHAFHPMSRAQARAILGWGSESVILFSHHFNEYRKRFDLAEQTMSHVNESLPDARLQLLRNIPHAQMPLVMAAADCLMVTSDREGSPNVVREAIASGLPIVSVDVGDIAELLPAFPGSGYIVPRKPSQIAEAVLHVLSQRTNNHVLRYSVEPLSLESIAAKVRAVYSSALMHKHGHHLRYAIAH